MIKMLCWGGAQGTTTPSMLEEFLQNPTTLKWYIVPIFVIVMYLAVSLVKKKQYSILFGAVAFWLMDVFNETWNSMVYATTGQPVWGTTAAGSSAFQILIGYNIEICFMFLVLGMMACKLLTTSEGYEGEKFMDGNKNWLNDPNNMYYKANVKTSELNEEEKIIKRKAVLGRVIPAIVGSILAVIVEIVLNACGVLTWEKPWWQPNFPFILFIIGYCPFFFAAVVVHDLPRKWQLITLGIILTVVIALLIISGSLGMLGSQMANGWKWLK